MSKIKSMKLRYKVGVGVATGAALLAGGGAAFAYFTSTGNGSGDASVGSATSWTVTVSSDTSNTLLPGSGSETLNYTVKNASTAGQELTGLSATVGDSGASDACLGSWFTAAVDHPTPNTEVAGGGTYSGTITVTMTDAAANQDACEGLTSVPVTLSAS